MVKKYLVSDWNLEEEFQKQFKKLCRLPSAKKGFIEVVKVSELNERLDKITLKMELNNDETGLHVLKELRDELREASSLRKELVK